MFVVYNLFMTRWNVKNRHKFLLQYHIIFVCKYRKKLFLSKNISDDIKILSYDICKRHNIIIKYVETDKDYIHYMIELNPNISVSKVVCLIKSYTTYHIWRKYSKYLSKYFWKDKTFWTDGYFVSTIGNISEETLHTYIENQG